MAGDGRDPGGSGLEWEPGWSRLEGEPGGAERGRCVPAQEHQNPGLDFSGAWIRRRLGRRIGRRSGRQIGRRSGRRIRRRLVLAAACLLTLVGLPGLSACGPGGLPGGEAPGVPAPPAPGAQPPGDPDPPGMDDPPPTVEPPAVAPPVTDPPPRPLPPVAVPGVPRFEWPAPGAAGATGADRFFWGYPTTASFLEAPPEGAGMSAEALARVDSVLLSAVHAGVTPGATLAVGRGGRLVRLRGYGWLDHGGARLASPATLYDIASLTKVMGTTTAVMILEQEGRLSLGDPVVRHLPGFDRGDPRKATVTVRHLLLHESGLAAGRPWYRDRSGPEAYREALFDEPLLAEPGARTVYSDLGAIALGLVVEAASGQLLDRLLAERVFAPLGMDDTGFLPDSVRLPRVAPTEVDTLWRGAHVWGDVHDENAHAMGGVAGHAGLFSTAFDLAVFSDLMLRGGVAPPCRPEVEGGVPCAWPRADSLRLLRGETLAAYTRRQGAGASSRALGWDTPSGRSSAGDYLSAASFGHTGFTGTSIWIDPELDLYVVLLTNRVNPTRAENRHIALRRDVHDAVAAAITDRTVPRRDP